MTTRLEGLVSFISEIRKGPKRTLTIALTLTLTLTLHTSIQWVVCS